MEPGNPRWRAEETHCGSRAYEATMTNGAPSGSPSRRPYSLGSSLGLDRRAHLIDDTASAHLHQESDPGPFLPIECQVDEGRDAYQAEANWRDVPAGERYRV